MRKKTASLKIAAYLILCFVMLPCSLVHADIRSCQLSPIRVIMEGRTRSATVTLINSDAVVNTYKLSLVLMSMDDRGELSPIKEPTPEQEAIIRLFRFSPKRARVEPGKYQNIRIMVRKPADLPPGEYRAHLRATPLPPPPAPKKNNQNKKGRVNLDILMATSIPIILRHGEGSVTLTPTSCTLGKDGKSLSVQVKRTGKFSAYFGVIAYRMGPDGTKEKIAKRLGMGYYPPATERTVKLPLENPALFHFLADQKIFLEILNYENLSEPAKGPWEFTLQ